MNIAEAMQALLDGEKLKHKDWRSGIFVCLIDRKLFLYVNNTPREIFNLTLSDDFEIYKTPPINPKLTFKPGDRVIAVKDKIENDIVYFSKGDMGTVQNVDNQLYVKWDKSNSKYVGYSYVLNITDK